jgi:hypothetical protein
MDVKWVRIDSWHILAREEAQHTFCGLERPPGETLDRLPGGSEKSCENCLIVLASRTGKDPKEQQVDEFMHEPIPDETGAVARPPEDDEGPSESDEDAGADDDDVDLSQTVE